MEYIYEITINGETRQFPSDTTISIGRGDCTIPVDDPALSRCHAYVVIDSNDRAYFGDGHPSGKPSRNGSYVKGVHCKNSMIIPLKGGEQIRLGSDLVLSFQKKTLKSSDNNETLGLEDSPS